MQGRGEVAPFLFEESLLTERIYSCGVQGSLSSWKNLARGLFEGIFSLQRLHLLLLLEVLHHLLRRFLRSASRIFSEQILHVLHQVFICLLIDDKSELVDEIPEGFKIFLVWFAASLVLHEDI